MKTHEITEDRALELVEEYCGKCEKTVYKIEDNPTAFELFLKGCGLSESGIDKVFNYRLADQVSKFLELSTDEFQNEINAAQKILRERGMK